MFLYEYLSAGGAVEAGADSLLLEGRAMREALATELRMLPGWQVTVAGLPGEPGCRAARAGETPAAFVAREAAGHRYVWVVAPETAGLLGRLQAAVPRGVGWIGCSADAIGIASSKRRTAECLAAAGVPVPRPGLDAAGRWVLKPDDGAGSVDTHCLAAAPARLPPGQRLEPWVDGEPMSLSLLGQPGGIELLSVNRQQVTVAPDGVVHCAVPRPNVLGPADTRWPVLRRLATAVAAAIPGLRGFVGIDLVWHPVAGPVVIEVNPRVTTALVGLSAALGRPVVRAVMEGGCDVDTEA